MLYFQVCFWSNIWSFAHCSVRPKWYGTLPIQQAGIPLTVRCLIKNCTGTTENVNYEHYAVWNHRQLYCLFNRLFRLMTKKTSRLCITGPLWEESTWRQPMDSHHIGSVIQRVICLDPLNVMLPTHVAHRLHILTKSFLSGDQGQTTMPSFRSGHAGPLITVFAKWRNYGIFLWASKQVGVR